MLGANDIESANAGLIYTITALPAGVLENTNTGLPLGLGDTFTQGDIDNGFIRYTHDGGESTSENLSFTIDDGTDVTAVQSFVFTITPVNDLPTDIDMDGSEVSEDAVDGHVVAELTAMDVDLPGDVFTYTLLDDADGLFRIEGNKLVVNGALDFETAQSLDIRIRVDDNNGGTFDKDFTVDILDVQERTNEGFIPPREERRGSGFVSVFEGFRGRVTDEIFRAIDILEPERFFARNGIIQATLGGEEMQSEALYGEDMQILRENTTMEIRNILGLQNSIYVPGIEDFVPVLSGLQTGQDSVHDFTAEKFTNLRESLAFLNALNEAGITEESEARQNIEHQFEDVLNYHKARQDRLREALSQQG